MKISDKAKAIIAGIGLILTPLTAATADNVIDITEGQALIAALVQAAIAVYLVWRVPNKGFVTSELAARRLSEAFHGASIPLEVSAELLTDPDFDIEALVRRALRRRTGF